MFQHGIEKLIAASLIAILLPYRAAASDPKLAEGGLGEKLAEICRKYDVPSLTIAAVRSDEIITTQCSGVRKRGTEEAVALTDRHPLGSCTKSMTATLAAALVEAGTIQWDTTIQQVWPRGAEKRINPSLQNVTLSELLSHQSGLPSDLKGKEWTSFFAEKASPRAERRRMLDLILKHEPEHPHGEFHYSNLGYVVAAAMLETKSGDSYEDLMHRHLFQPLKMTTADFRTMAVAKKIKPPLLWGHRPNGTPIDPRTAGAENPSVYAPCGTVHLSIADFARYAQWHLKEVPNPILSEKKSIDHLHSGQVDAPALGGKYGCGWIVLRTGLGRALTHGGSNTNSFALIWILPEKDFAAVACTNTGADSGFQACNEAIEDLMKQYAQN